jgi:acetyl esterase/lipase
MKAMSFITELFNRRYERYLADSDVAYNEHSSLDVYMAANSKSQNLPVIIFWYGGAWTDGSKDLYRFVADYLARSTGSIVVVPDYRKYPDVKFPVFAEEAWQAVRWVQENITGYGGDPDNYSVIGHSSGGHTAGLVALGAYRPKELALPRRCAALSAPNCFVGENLYDIFGDARTRHQAFPNDFVSQVGDSYLTEFLLLQGIYDQVIYPRQQTEFLSALRSRGISAKYHRTKTTHIGQVMSIGSPFFRFTKSARLVRDFLSE